MIKAERQKLIIELLNRDEIVKVSDITKKISVTDMTVRRDLQELEEKGLLIRVHGGAKSISEKKLTDTELSHLEKKDIHLNEKIEIAKLVADNIFEGDTVFLGSGTTLELVYDYLTISYAKIITNSIYVFNKFKDDAQFDLILIGGTYRPKTGAFVGTIANDFVSSIHVQKAFIGVNALEQDGIYNSNEDEGLTQSHILNSAQKKYIVADHSKFDKRDFYRFYNLSEVDFLLTDSAINEEKYKNYSFFTKIIKPDTKEDSEK